MPNWTYNEVTFEKPETLMKYVTDGNFDFNKVIPMPKELENTISGGIINECIDLYNIQNMKLADFKKNRKSYTATYEETKKRIIAALEERIGDNPRMFMDELHYYPQEEREIGFRIIQENYGHTGYEIGEYYVNLKKKYGDYNWYMWSINNWGVKWNACESNIYEKDAFATFSTPWSMPTEVYQKICEDNPDEHIVFYGEYEEGGEITYHNVNGFLKEV